MATRTQRQFELVFDGKMGRGLMAATNATTKRLREVEDGIRHIGEKQRELEKLRRQMDKAGMSTGDLAQEMRRLRKDMSDAEIEAVGLNSKLDRVRQQEAKLQGLRAASSSNKAALNDTRGQMLDAAGMAMILYKPAQDAMRFEDSMADVRKVVDGLDSKRAFNRMSKDIINLTTRGKIPMAADQLAQIVAAGGQAGIERKGLTAFARDAAKMGIAFDITAEEAGGAMANWRTAFRMNQKEVVVLADKINYLGNVTAASSPQISEVVTRIGPLGEVGGLASGEIAALAAAMVGMGTSPEIAATGIKKVITTLNAGTAVTKRQADAFDALGIDAVKLSKRMQKDAGGAIVSVFNALKKMPKYQQTALLKDMFGEESLAAVGALLPTLNNVQDLLQKVGNKSNYAGSMQKEFASRSKTASNSLQLLKNEAVAASVSTGSVLLPELVKIARQLGPIIRAAVSWAEKNPVLFSTIVKITAGLVALRVAVLAGQYAFLLIKGGVIDFALAAFRAAKFLKIAQVAQWLFNTSLYGCPIVWIIAGLAALGVAIYLLVKHWDKVKAAMLGAWNWFIKFATEGPGRFIPLISAIGLVVKHWGLIKTGVMVAWNWLKKFVTEGSGRFIPIVAAIRLVAQHWDKIVSAIKTAVSWMIKFGKYSNPVLLAYNAARSIASRGKAPARHARGGIVTRPQVSWIGEQGPEAIIPLSGYRSRARSLLDQAAQMIGPSPAGAGAGGIQVNMPVTFNGNTSPADVSSVLVSANQNLKMMLRSLIREETQNMSRRSMG